LRLNKKQTKRLRSRVNRIAVEQMKQRKNQGALHDQADFLMGAACVLQMLFPGKKGELSATVPAGWIIGIMRSNDFTAEKQPNRDLLKGPGIRRKNKPQTED
jgi:hypothetical protein